MPISEINDDVVEMFSRGEKKAYNIIYDYYYEIVSRNINKIVHQQHVAEDILQDVFLKLWENKHKFTDKASIGSWLFRVSYNTSVSYIRDLLKERSCSSELLRQSPIEKGFPEDLFKVAGLKEELLQEAIGLLPVRKRQSFELCKLQGKSYAEAATILGISAETVKEYLSDSTKYVKKYLLSKYSTSVISAVSVVLSILLNAH